VLLASKAPAVSGFVVRTPQQTSVINHHKREYRQRTTTITNVSQNNNNAKRKYSFLESAPNGSMEVEERATEIFNKFDVDKSGGICVDELNEVLKSLEVEATVEETNALFSYLDVNGDGSISLEEFLPWYSGSVQDVVSVRDDFQKLLMSRTTVNKFDSSSPVSDDVLRRAIKCAIEAPNRSGSEPWGFIKIGPETVEKLQELNAKVNMAGGETWNEIPGWCVVTTKLTPTDEVVELRDFRSTCCAIQNFMLSMWSEGVGSKWTEGPTQKSQQFADICGIDTSTDKVAGIIWYGFPAIDGGLNDELKTQRKKDVDDVLTELP
jgi:nitroreductase